MTTSLPTTSPETAAGVAPQLGADLAALLATTAVPAPGHGATAPQDFLALLSGDAAAVTPATTPELAPTATLATPRCVPNRATDARLVAATASETSESEPATGETASAPDRTTLEAALALVLPMLTTQSPAPVELAEPELAPASAKNVPTTDSARAGESAEFSPASQSSAAPSAAQTTAAPRVSLVLPGQPALTLPLSSESAPAELAASFERLLPQTADVPAEPQTTGNSPLAAAPDSPVEKAAPVAIESSAAKPATAKLAMNTATSAALPVATRFTGPATAMSENASTPLASPASAPAVATTVARPAQNAPAPAAAPELAAAAVADEVTASVELPDGSVVRVAAPLERRAPRSSPAAVSAVSATAGPEKSAAAPRRENVARVEENIGSGKNFLSALDKELSPLAQKAGIGVAQEHPTMFLPPHDALPTVSPTVSAHVAFVAAPEQAAISERLPMPELTAASLAHRAVEAVTDVVEAQAASKLQPVPSVQLKFRVGTDDLAVRVELRGGVVRTEFRTDSPELRSALTHEWQAVVAQPESALRFLEPVISSANGGSPQGQSSFAQGNPQNFAQQQQQQQSHQQSRAAAEFFGSVARSTPYQPRDGGLATPAAPLVAPTSLHLSAVA